MADEMKNLSKAVLERMPPDLAQYILKQKPITNVSACEQEPAGVAFEVISEGIFEMIACFPVSSSGETVVFMHLPRGGPKEHLHCDGANIHRHLQERYRQGPKLEHKYGQGFLNRSYEAAAESNLRNRFRVHVGCRSALEVSFRQILKDCQW